MKNLSSLLIFLFVSTANYISAQDNRLITLKDSLTKRNTIYFEALGEGGGYSFAHDRLYRVNKKIRTSFTIGVTFIPGVNSMFITGVPLSYNFIFGKKKNHFEMGTGISFMAFSATSLVVEVNKSYYSHVTEYFATFTPKIGYRFQKPNGGFFFRVTFTPMFNLVTYTADDTDNKPVSFFSSFRGFGTRPWAGISFGYTLKRK